jgi:NAD(P)H-hydrate epimerase
VVLKGAGTLVATPDEPTVIQDLAAPALAVGGSGDVLAGVIAGLYAQGVPADAAALTAVWLHGHVGREWERERLNRGALPQEIADGIPSAMASLLTGR